MIQYESLFKRYKEQDTQKIFAHFSWNSAEGENWETPFERLANMAKEEEWDFKSAQYKKTGKTIPY